MRYNEDMRRLEAFERTETLYVIVWQAYGEWKATTPFASEADAQKHIDFYLARPDKDYNKKITIVPIPKPA